MVIKVLSLCWGHEMNVEEQGTTGAVSTATIDRGRETVNMAIDMGVEMGHGRCRGHDHGHGHGHRRGEGGGILAGRLGGATGGGIIIPEEVTTIEAMKVVDAMIAGGSVTTEEEEEEEEEERGPGKETTPI